MEKNSRGYVMMTALPPVDVVPVKEIAAAIRQFEERQQSFVAEVAHIRELDNRVTRGRAVRADQEAFAAALRRGAPDPGRKVQDNLDKDLEAARRRRDALELACEADAQDLGATLSAHGPQLAEICERQFNEALADVAAALATMGQAWGRAVQARSLREWARSGGQFVVREPSILVGSGTTRTAASFVDIISSLHELTVDASPEPSYLVEDESKEEAFVG
jgi:hypothetical protein